MKSPNIQKENKEREIQPKRGINRKGRMTNGEQNLLSI